MRERKLFSSCLSNLICWDLDSFGIHFCLKYGETNYVNLIFILTYATASLASHACLV